MLFKPKSPDKLKEIFFNFKKYIKKNDLKQLKIVNNEQKSIFLNSKPFIVGTQQNNNSKLIK